MPSPSEYPELASWISNQRARRRAGKSSLTAERIQKLDAIGMIWEPLQHSWEANFRLAQDFFRENGHLDIHRGHALFPWLAQQRTAKRLGTLSAAREAQLNKIGMCWNVNDASWERMYAAAAEYYRFHGLSTFRQAMSPGTGSGSARGSVGSAGHTRTGTRCVIPKLTRASKGSMKSA